MARKSSLAGVVVLAVLASVVLAAQSGQSLRGVWRVVEVTNATGQANSKPEPGLYIFTDRHYSIMRVTAPRASLPEKPTEKDEAAAFVPFIANSGTYQVKGDQLMTQPLVAKNPNVMMGKGGTSMLRFEGKDVVHVTGPGKVSVKLQRIE
jgi:hypothetical protein